MHKIILFIARYLVSLSVARSTHEMWHCNLIVILWRHHAAAYCGGHILIDFSIFTSGLNNVLTRISHKIPCDEEECKMEKQERIPRDQKKWRKQDTQKIKLNFKLNLSTKNLSQKQRHLVCLQIISNMFSLSLVACSTELNLHVILAVVHMC